MHSSIKEVSFSGASFSKEVAMLLLACEGECCSLMFYTFYSSFVYSTLLHTRICTYLACADRLTGWHILYRPEPGHATITELMSICRQLFQRNSVPTAAHLSPPVHSKNSFGHVVLSTAYPPLHIPYPMAGESSQLKLQRGL